MKIGFPFGIYGPGGVRSWIKVFSDYCIEKGYEVAYSHDEKVDVFITIANCSKYEQLVKIKQSGAKIIHRIDGLFFDYHIYENQSSELVNKELARNMELADLIICQSEFCNTLVDYLLGKDNKIPRAIIYNGADTKFFSPEGIKVERDYDKKMVLSIAYWGVPRMAEFSINTIINIAKLLPDYEFWILGLAYPQTEKMVIDANLPNITRVNLRKAIQHDEMPEYLRAADLVLHTRPHDGCSNLIIEAMNVNKPVVGLCSGSTPELLGDAGLTGRCNGSFEKLPVADYVDISNQIVKTFDNYEYYKNKITERSKMFSQEIMSEAYLSEIVKILSL